MVELVGRSKKLPKNYQLVFDVVAAQPEGVHAAAGEIYASARHRQPGIGYSTVYRALDRLRDLGLVLEVRVPGAASALYEPSRANHAHFLCERCGRIDDIHYGLPQHEISSVAEAHGIDVTTVALTFNGVCRSCRGVRHDTFSVSDGRLA